MVKLIKCYSYILTSLMEVNHAMLILAVLHMYSRFSNGGARELKAHIYELFRVLWLTKI